METIGHLHNTYIFLRRVKAITKAIAPLTNEGTVLDVGAGNGLIAKQLMMLRTDINAIGIDVHLREDAYIEVRKYDGQLIPFEDDKFSSVLLIDVLHHSEAPDQTLKECLRVSSGNVVIKDHFYSNLMQYILLRIMDWTGNAPHGVRLPYNYFARRTWEHLLDSIGAKEEYRQEEVPNLYPQPFQQLIGRNIQFVAVVVKQ